MTDDYIPDAQEPGDQKLVSLSYAVERGGGADGGGMCDE